MAFNDMMFHVLISVRMSGEGLKLRLRYNIDRM